MEKFNGFYFSVAKAVEDMTIDEYEIESYERCAERCREIGQGISTKEFVRYRKCNERVLALS